MNKKITDDIVIANRKLNLRMACNHILNELDKNVDLISIQNQIIVMQNCVNDLEAIERKGKEMKAYKKIHFYYQGFKLEGLVLSEDKNFYYIKTHFTENKYKVNKTNMEGERDE